MWFIFPQIAGLGRSPTARFYAIADRDEAIRYRAHSVLGRRLLVATAAVQRWAGESTLQDIFGPVDALKFVSSMTLFEAVSEPFSPFSSALAAFDGGRRDRATLERT
jgi:uncharacterized protein (DUF1810 family)